MSIRGENKAKTKTKEKSILYQKVIFSLFFLSFSSDEQISKQKPLRHLGIECKTTQFTAINVDTLSHFMNFSRLPYTL